MRITNSFLIAKINSCFWYSLDFKIAKPIIFQSSSNIVECSDCKARSTDFHFKLPITHVLYCFCPTALVDISERLSYHRAGKHIIIRITSFLIFPIIYQSECRHTFHRYLISNEKFLFFIDLWLKCGILVNKWKILLT